MSVEILGPNTLTCSSDQEGLTMATIEKIIPARLKNNITQELVDTVNDVIRDPQVADNFRENFLGYSTVLGGGRFKLEQYISACKYISFKALGDTNQVAWSKTFPDRYQRLIQEGYDAQYISSQVAAYNRTKLVNLIVEQTLVPTHILNHDLYQKSLNVLAEIMVNGKSEKCRVDAATNLANQLKPPVDKKIQLDIGTHEDDSIKELRNATLALAAEQRRMIEAGIMTTREVAESRVLNRFVDGETVE